MTRADTPKSGRFRKLPKGLSYVIIATCFPPPLCTSFYLMSLPAAFSPGRGAGGGKGPGHPPLSGHLPSKRDERGIFTPLRTFFAKKGLQAKPPTHRLSSPSRSRDFEQRNTRRRPGIWMFRIGTGPRKPLRAARDYVGGPC